VIETKKLKRTSSVRKK